MTPGRIRPGVMAFPALVLLLSAGTSGADRWIAEECARLPVLAPAAARAVLAAPLDWGGAEWLAAGGCAAAVGGAYLADGAVQRRVRASRGKTGDAVLAAVEPLGAEYSIALLAGFLAWGAALDDARAGATAVDGALAGLLAAAVVEGMKYTVGRSRPRQDEGPARFRPFSGDVSFPSGHTCFAFTTAAAVSGNYPGWAVGVLAYGLAAGVGLARIHHGAHFLSDVAAGAALGAAAGAAVVRANAGIRNAVTVRPETTRFGDPVLAASVSF